VKEEVMPLEIRQGTQEDLERLPALLISFGTRPAASADVSETPDEEDSESSASSATEED
jgi:hypothetical protein